MTTAGRVDAAAVLASHGDRAGAEPNCTLMFHADAVRRLVRLRAVTAGVLKGEPSIEDALEEAHAFGGRDVVVYPLFMSEGYFTGTVLPNRVRAAGFEKTTRILPPLGVDPGVSELILSDAVVAAQRTSLDPRMSRLLIVGHGSKYGREPAEAAQEAAERVACAGRFASVSAAFLEEEPFLNAALEGAPGPTIVSGFFFGDGMHAGENVPAAIRAVGADAVYAGPIGRSQGIPALIASALRTEMKARTH